LLWRSYFLTQQERECLRAGDVMAKLI